MTVCSESALGNFVMSSGYQDMAMVGGNSSGGSRCVIHVVYIPDDRS
jgi:hypothetical protein